MTNILFYEMSTYPDLIQGSLFHFYDIFSIFIFLLWALKWLSKHLIFLYFKYRNLIWIVMKLSSILFGFNAKFVGTYDILLYKKNLLLQIFKTLKGVRHMLLKVVKQVFSDSKIQSNLPGGSIILRIKSSFIWSTHFGFLWLHNFSDKVSKQLNLF